MNEKPGVTLALLVDDYDKAIQFYSEQTQLFSVVANLRFGSNLRNVVLAYNNPSAPFRLAMYLATDSATSALVGRQAGDDNALLSLPVDHCIETYERLRRAGVRFTGEPIHIPYGCQACFVDPFGNEICLLELF